MAAAFAFRIQVWNVATGKSLFQIHAHESQIYTLAFSPDSKWLASGSADKTARIWDVATGKEQYRFERAGEVAALAFMPDGKTLITTGSSDHTAYLSDIATGKTIRSFRHEGFLHQLALSPDGKTLATSANADAPTIITWDTATGKEIRRIDEEGDSLTFSSDGKSLFAASSFGLHRWDVDTGREITKYVDADLIPAERWYTTFSPARKLAAYISFPQEFRIADMTQAKRLAQFAIADERYQLWAIAFSPDGKALAVGGDGPNIELRDVDNGKLIRKLERL